MLEVLCAEDSLLCFDGSSTCAWFTAMLDGDFVLSKAHAYKSNRKQQIRLSSTPSYLVSKYNGAEGKKKIGYEIIVFGQILPHKIGVLDLRSPNSQIQFPYTPNTTPIKDGLIYIRGCQSDSTWSAGQKKIRGTSAKLQRDHKKKNITETKERKEQ